MMVIAEYYGMRLFLKLLKVPRHILFPVVLVLCIVGAFSSNNRVFDVWSIIWFALLGYGLTKFDFPTAPFIMGYILGDMFELNLRRALIITNGSYLGLFSRPISATVLIASAAFLIFMLIKRRTRTAY
jgi:putative tricarboxylic transport membrane protein